MSILNSRVASVLAALLVTAAFTGCTGTAHFPVERRVQVDDAPSGVAGLSVVDLSASGDAWVNRNCLKGVTIRRATAFIATVDGGNAATRGSGTLALRPEGAPTDGSQDVVMGRFDDLPILTGLELQLDPSPAASAVLREALEGTGKLALVMRGDTNARPVGFSVSVQLDVGVRYDPLRRLEL